MPITELQLQSWLAAFWWPFLRVGALVMAAPVLNSRQVPIRYRTLLAVLLTLVIVPTLPAAPVLDPLSPDGVVAALQQIIIGVAMGFVLQMAFSAIVFGGQVIANKMGLGFAAMVDPQNGVQVPVLSQYYLILVTLMFLLLDGHLILIRLLAESFHTLPIGPEGLGRSDFEAVVAWGSRMFAWGLMVALPAVGSLMLVNLGFGIITRAAPQLHIFAIGFPLGMLLGFGVIWVSLSGALHGFTELLDEAFVLIKSLVLIGS